jgi:death-on-curing protein
MIDTKFLTLDEILDLHTIAINRHGGLHGIRDQALLESALGQPEMHVFGRYVHNDIYLMAAAYCFHIIKNHAFLDGNKRTGIACALFFLEKNNIFLNIDSDSICDLAVKIAKSEINKEEIAASLRKFHKAKTKKYKN